MADLATTLLRTVARAFYTVEHVLVIDALILHSTLQDTDLAHVLGMQVKSLRKLCGRLREDGLLSVQTRAERRTDAIPPFYGGSSQTGGDVKQKGERLQTRDWYYLNYHRAIDSVKYKVHKLNRWVDSLGAPSAEKKDWRCPRCKAEYTDLEAVEIMDMPTGEFLCKRCKHALDQVEEEEKTSENEMKKRLNLQMAKVITLLRKIDEAVVPENAFDDALAKHIPVNRGAENPGAKNIQIVDVPNKNLESTKGLELKPERVAVNLQDEESVKNDAEAEERAKREREAKQNALPEWISKSTVSGDITAVGAIEEKLRREREAHAGAGPIGADVSADEKKTSTGDNDDVMAAYWEELARAQEREAAATADDDDEDEDEEDDEFEDVAGVGGSGETKRARNGDSGPYMMSGANGTGASTPAEGAGSSNATDDEHEAKRVKIQAPATTASALATNGVPDGGAQGTPADSDEDDDDDLEFENV